MMYRGRFWFLKFELIDFRIPSDLFFNMLNVQDYQKPPSEGVHGWQVGPTLRCHWLYFSEGLLAIRLILVLSEGNFLQNQQSELTLYFILIYMYGVKKIKENMKRISFQDEEYDNYQTPLEFKSLDSKELLFSAQSTPLISRHTKEEYDKLPEFPPLAKTLSKRSVASREPLSGRLEVSSNVDPNRASEEPQIVIKHPEYNENEDDEAESRPKYRKHISIVNQNGIDVDAVFGFKRKVHKRISLPKRFTRMLGVSIIEDYDGAKLFENVPSYFAFLVLGLSVVLNTMIIPLFISIPEITVSMIDLIRQWSRNGWRFLFQALILIPFVLHEKRTGNEDVARCYKWANAFESNNIRQLFLSSINTSLQTTIFIVFSQYNYIANVVHSYQYEKNCLLSSMTNFWLSVTRQVNNERRHKIELPGQLMCLVGYSVTSSTNRIGIITFDCYSVSPDDLPPKLFTKYRFNDHFFIHPWQKVVLGIIVPVFDIQDIKIVVAILTTQISLYTQDLKDVYPPFLQLFLISIFTSLNLNSVGYFMYCTSVDGTHFTGWFGFIVDGAFTKFMYVAIVFNFGIFFTQVLISELYDPIIPASTALLEPPFTAFFLDVFGFQYMPSSVSALGYILILPGQFIIIFGQYLLQKQPVSQSSKQLSSKFSPPKLSSIMRQKYKTNSGNQLNSVKTLNNEEAKENNKQV